MRNQIKVIWDENVDISSNGVNTFIKSHPEIMRFDYDVEYLQRLIIEENYKKLEEIKQSMNKSVNGSIVIIADLKVGNKRKSAYLLIRSNNIADCFVSRITSNTKCKWYIDNRGNLRGEEKHEKGLNYYLYREIREELNPEEVREFLNKVKDNSIRNADITKYTKSMGRYVLDLCSK